MSVTDRDIEFWEQERRRLEDDPSVLEEEYENVTDDVLPAEVDALLADFSMGTMKPEKFHELSREHQDLFLEHLSREYQSIQKLA